MMLLWSRLAAADVADDVRAAESARFEAMVNADVEALGAMLRDDLTYVHSSGDLQTKEALLAEIGSGHLDYLAITPSDQAVRRFGRTALVTGVAVVQVKRGDDELSIRLRYSEVYVRERGAWQLAAWQSLRM